MSMTKNPFPYGRRAAFKTAASRVSALSLTMAAILACDVNPQDEMDYYSYKARTDRLSQRFDDLNARFKKTQRERYVLDESRFHLQEPAQFQSPAQLSSGWYAHLSEDDRAKLKDSYVMKVHADLTVLMSHVNVALNAAAKLENVTPTEMPACLIKLPAYLADAKKARSSIVPYFPTEGTALKRKEQEVAFKQSLLRTQYSQTYKNLGLMEGWMDEYESGIHALDEQIKRTKPIYDEAKRNLQEHYLAIWEARTLLTLWQQKCVAEINVQNEKVAAQQAATSNSKIEPR